MSLYQSPQDEGYSEDPLTAQLSSPSGRDSMDPLPEWLLDMPAALRARFAMKLISTLPTPEVVKVLEALNPRIHINFLNRLPPEVCLKILGYLDPVSLISTARSSRDWMSLSMDRKLWKHLYFMEGWRILETELENFEQEMERQHIRFTRARPSIDQGDEHTDKKRATLNYNTIAPGVNEDSEMLDVDSTPVPQPVSVFGHQPTQKTAPITGGTAPDSFTDGYANDTKIFRSQQGTQSLFGSSHRDSILSSKSGGEGDLSFLSSLVVRDRRTNLQKLNWQHLYTQRRRLEANWEHQNYVNFQLPHPDHLDEMHQECIYTIQHSGQYLVSGSRDKTLRIWDLDTRRLVKPPLKGHRGSVLCLQFDADPKEDIIVSGSSDSTVNIWKFSTGELVQTLKNAHSESVLNVRFDKQILVTCSKDKTIKIFNRRSLHPGELGYPRSQQPMRPVPTVLNNYGFNPSPLADLPIKHPYSLIGVLEGHGAAVNAVQIYKNEIVSASGDRHVKVWDWPLQTCTRTLVGHQKGIACVQYDGRRIVSGSSDNEVKVFDKETGLEVASLRAHQNLVRTVQAGFGDLPYSAEEDQADARAVDYEYFKAVDSGVVPRTLHRGQPRNAGSRKPEDIMAYGAKLPPGGGGGKYGRIVSGSYDETIIIWRRDKEGVWKAQHTLRQADAAQAASREFEEVPQLPHGGASAAARPNNSVTPGTQAYFHMIINQTVPQGPQALQHAINQYPQLLSYPHLNTLISSVQSSATRNSLRAIVTAARSRQQLLLIQQSQQALSQAPAAAQVPVAHPQPQMPTPQHTITPPQNAALENAAIPNPPAAAVAIHAVQAQGPNMARVFKLQFDARRIICCSQTATIVGWDFANGDQKIIEASRFFAPIE